MTRQRTKNKIDRIELTSDNLTSRAGLTPWVHYLDRINIYGLLDRYPNEVRLHGAGLRLDPQIIQGSQCGRSIQATVVLLSGWDGSTPDLL